MSRLFASFTTSHGGFPHTCGFVADCRGGELHVKDFAFAAMARPTFRPGAAASGKIAIVRHGSIAVYQSSSTGHIVPVFCGNATAAALRFLNSDGECRLQIHSADLNYEVYAEISGRSVTQTWTVSHTGFEERVWRGRRVIVMHTLNSYALVTGPLPDGVTAEVARRELLNADVGTKLAIIGEGVTPIIEFHNANGRHGAVPQTGLATLAIAARSLPWLADLFPDMRAAYRTRGGTATHALPPIAEMRDGRLVIALAPIDVELRELVLGEAA